MIGGQNEHSSFAEIFSATQPYFFKDDLTWCVRHAKAIPAWNNLYYIASWDIIVIGLIAVCIGVIFIYSMAASEKHPVDIWTVITSSLQMIILFPADLFPKRMIARFFFAWYLITTLLMTTTFLAFYYNFIMRTLYETQINTFDRIVSNDLMLGGDKNKKLFD